MHVSGLELMKEATDRAKGKKSSISKAALARKAKQAALAKAAAKKEARKR